MIAYKLLRVRKDGSLGSLYFDRRTPLELGVWLLARQHFRRGFTPRVGWHALLRPWAPHLSAKGRRWYRVELENVETLERPTAQGGTWLIGQAMFIVGSAKHAGWKTAE